MSSCDLKKDGDKHDDDDAEDNEHNGNQNGPQLQL